MPAPVLWGNLGVIEMMFKPLRDRREVAHDVRGRVLDCGHSLPGDTLEGVLRDLCSFLAHV
jgi:haloacetate dehalogenase